MMKRTQIPIAILILLSVLTGCAARESELPACLVAEVQGNDSSTPTQALITVQSPETTEEPVVPSNPPMEPTEKARVEDANPAEESEGVHTLAESFAVEKPNVSGQTEAEIPTQSQLPVSTEPPAVPQGSAPRPTESPAETEPAPTVPTPTHTAPEETEPVQPEATTPVNPEPVGCSHEWQCIHHDALGHWVAGVICDCGWTAYGSPDTLTALWNAHSASYSPEEALFEHGGFGCADEWIEDEPAYDEWVCRHCGEQKP